MTTFTTEDRMNTYPRVGSTWVSTSMEKFTIMAITNPNEEPDPWVSYRNQADDTIFSCRLPAFVSRFTLLTD